MSVSIENIRLLIFGSRTFDEQDDMIEMLRDVAETRLKTIMNRTAIRYGHDEVTHIPSDLEWIVAEAVAHRFNRIGSEGMTSEGVEGHSITYADDDFARYEQIIEEYYKPIEKVRDRRGSVVGYP